MSFNQFKKIFILSVLILFLSKILFALNFYQNHKKTDINIVDDSKYIDNKKNYQSEINENKNLFATFNFVQKLAYQGMKQFKKGLLEGNTQYETIYIADPELFIEFVVQGTLKTTSSPLIQGTIDFISKCLKKNINLYINEKHSFSTIENFSKDYEILDLKIRYQNNVHFFVIKYNDTIGDGYCFFHALNNVLEKQIPNWQKNICF